MRLALSSIILILAAVTGRGEDAKALLGDGLEQLRQARFELAADAFRRALKLDPALMIAQYDLGICYFAEGQLGDARKALSKRWHCPRKIVSPHTIWPESISFRNGWLTQSGDLKCSHMACLSPTILTISALLTSGKAISPGAIQTLKRAAESNPDDSRIHYLLARVYRRAGKITEAEREFRRLPVDIEIDSQKGRSADQCV